MRHVLILLALLITNVANAIDCEKTPNCEELGYSKENDPNCLEDGYMLCPFDFTFKKCVEKDCAKLGFTTSDKSSWCKEIIKCQGNEDYTLCNEKIIPLNCEIGDVYYADGSCGKVNDYVKDSSPKPIGVVYWVTEDKQHGKVINLKDLGRSSSSAKFDPADPYQTRNKTFQWGSYRMDIPDVKNWDCNTGGYASTAKTGDHDNEFWSGGKEYTEIIAKAQSDDLQYAAPAARAFYPPDVDQNDSKVGQGNWYLPTVGELMDLYGYDYPNVSGCQETTGSNGQTKNKVNATLTTLKSKGVTAETLTNNYYWSSSEYNSDRSWKLGMNSGTRYYYSKLSSYSVRASLEF